MLQWNPCARRASVWYASAEAQHALQLGPLQAPFGVGTSSVLQTTALLYFPPCS